MMKLFNIVLAVTFASMPAVAAANKQENSKHGDAKSIFVAHEDESLFKNFPKSVSDLEDHYLVGSSDKLSSYSKQEHRKQFSEDSFQSKFESEDKHSKDNSWFGDHKFLTGNNSDHLSHGSDNDDRNHSSTKGFGDYCKKADWDNHGWDGQHGWENHHESDNHPAPTPVPEPTSYVLMLAGLLMLGLNKRRSN